MTNEEVTNEMMMISTLNWILFYTHFLDTAVTTSSDFWLPFACF